MTNEDLLYKIYKAVSFMFLIIFVLSTCLFLITDKGYQVINDRAFFLDHYSQFVQLIELLSFSLFIYFLLLARFANKAIKQNKETENGLNDN